MAEEAKSSLSERVINSVDEIKQDEVVLLRHPEQEKLVPCTVMKILPEFNRIMVKVHPNNQELDAEEWCLSYRSFLAFDAELINQRCPPHGTAETIPKSVEDAEYTDKYPIYLFLVDDREVEFEAARGINDFNEIVNNNVLFGHFN